MVLLRKAAVLTDSTSRALWWAAAPASRDGTALRMMVHKQRSLKCSSGVLGHSCAFMSTAKRHPSWRSTDT